MQSSLKIHWSNTRTYGDVNCQAEKEHSKYYFELADVDHLREMFVLFEKEANTALEKGLVLPAHDYIFKCSHTFNILDTRGAIGVTERQAFFGRMRDLAKKTADLYVSQREQLEFPWLLKDTIGGAGSVAGKYVESSGKSANSLVDFLFELGTEELPVADLDSALVQLKQLAPTLFKDSRLAYKTMHVWGTPRRIVIFAEGVESKQADREMTVKGPPASRAFDADGKLTQAGEGFARGKGIDPSTLQVKEIDGGQYAVAEIYEKGKPAAAILSEELPRLIARIKFDKTMRWNSSKTTFSRPIRWLLAITDDEAVPFEYAGIESGNTTRGLRSLQPESILVSTPQDYFKFLKTQGIILDQGERWKLIEQQVSRIMQEAGADVEMDLALLDEVNNLVEAPTAFRGKFEDEYLKLPADVLISVMKKHQRYMPMKKSGKLLPYFIAVRNGDDLNLDVVADGNEQVIRARFADAAFFINEDLKAKLIDFLPRLGTLTFQLKLGSMLDKTHRIEKIVDDLIPILGVPETDKDVTRRAAQLCKADLVTKMVVEMTSLQGIMGRFYAMHSGEKEEVAQAIYEHYLPKSATDKSPSKMAGLVVGIADRLDTLAGLFAAGLAPTGTKDPFAQRRAALGLVQNLIQWNMDFDLGVGLDVASKQLPLKTSEESMVACLEFIIGRLRSMLLEQGYRFDVLDAVLAECGNNPALANLNIKELTAAIAEPDWLTNLQAYARCVRITRDQKETFELNPEDFADPAEGELYSVLQTCESQRPFGSVKRFMDAFLPMIPSINSFFDAVMVMAEDERLKNNRLALLQRISALPVGLVDLSKLEGF